LKNNQNKKKDFKTMNFLFKNIFFLQKICQVMKIRFKKKEKEKHKLQNLLKIEYFYHYILINVEKNKFGVCPWYPLENPQHVYRWVHW